MTRRPIVQASAEIDSTTARTLQGHDTRTPAVSVSVTFRLHDHERALAALENAVRDVREQISETDGDRHGQEDS